jgi:diphosphomevalonate decarboxylase
MNVHGKISYSSPSNIAIIKYWGKEPGDQVPMNPSLSMTLDNCRSFTTIDYVVKKGSTPHIEVVFQGKRSFDIEAKLQRWFTKISYFFSWLNYASLKIESHNNFPHSAGIASSASGMSTMAMCLSAIDGHVADIKMPGNELLSKISRLGSGSAARSVFGPWVLWGETELVAGASNDYAVAVPDIHEMFQDMHDSIIVVDREAKYISSRDGHTLMETHPWRNGRKQQAKQNLHELIPALRHGEWKTFEKITENEALSLHGLMLSSEGGLMLWKGSTLDWMHYIRQQRKKNDIPMAFTLDAGANIHLLYPANARKEVLDIMHAAPVQSLEFIHDKAGKGPEKLLDEYESF